eukprot:CAMPEP_0114558382 /NCGR_PEP_ID=MMETSP0114-20121206/10350_1 /TAXON_ID=31324 /ORGANISM="Goniomonas sp, Strain m" /LENGTH=301 /DNA_ID=CAMNT_0001743765 /DNA_START=7 /DNA_END=912 /DNA_ORIENTATION=+
MGIEWLDVKERGPRLGDLDESIECRRALRRRFEELSLIATRLCGGGQLRRCESGIRTASFISMYGAQVSALDMRLSQTLCALDAVESRDVRKPQIEVCLELEKDLHVLQTWMRQDQNPEPHEENKPQRYQAPDREPKPGEPSHPVKSPRDLQPDEEVIHELHRCFSGVREPSWVTHPDDVRWLDATKGGPKDGCPEEAKQCRQALRRRFEDLKTEALSVSRAPEGAELPARCLSDKRTATFRSAHRMEVSFLNMRLTQILCALDAVESRQERKDQIQLCLDLEGDMNKLRLWMGEEAVSDC